jgi:hypothetical protein
MPTIGLSVITTLKTTGRSGQPAAIKGGFGPSGSVYNYEIYYNVSNNDHVGIFIDTNDSSGTKL